MVKLIFDRFYSNIFNSFPLYYIYIYNGEKLEGYHVNYSYNNPSFSYNTKYPKIIVLYES